MPARVLRRGAAVAASLACVAGLAACGAGEDAGTRIAMRDLEFAPREATVRAGQAVQWRNEEEAPHDVVAVAGARFRSRTILRDGTFAFEARRPGPIRYVCTLHPGMTGTLRVVR